MTLWKKIEFFILGCVFMENKEYIDPALNKLET